MDDEQVDYRLIGSGPHGGLTVESWQWRAGTGAAYGHRRGGSVWGTRR